MIKDTQPSDSRFNRFKNRVLYPGLASAACVGVALMGGYETNPPEPQPTKTVAPISTEAFDVSR